MFVTSGVSVRRAELLTASSSTCKPYTQNNGAEEAVPMSIGFAGRLGQVDELAVRSSAHLTETPDVMNIQ